MHDVNEVEIAERIKEAITDNGGYGAISEKTGISQSTLVRMASGKTDPKLKDVMKVAHAANIPLHYIAYGFMDPKNTGLQSREAELQKNLDEYYEKTEKRLMELEKILLSSDHDQDAAKEVVKNDYYNNELDKVGAKLDAIDQVEEKYNNK